MRTLVLFDIDGTLLSAAGSGRRAIHGALRDVFGSTGPADYWFDGKTDPQIVRDLMRSDGHSDATIDARLPQVLAKYVERLGVELADPAYRPTVYPGVFPLLDALERHDGVTVGLLTGNIESGAKSKLRAVGLDPSRFVIGAFGSDHEHRPALPGVALARARALGIELEGASVTVIGDTPADVACGASVGARTVAVATGRFTVEELAACGAAAVFRDLRDTDAVVAALIPRA